MYSWQKEYVDAMGRQDFQTAATVLRTEVEGRHFKNENHRHRLLGRIERVAHAVRDNANRTLANQTSFVFEGQIHAMRQLTAAFPDNARFIYPGIKCPGKSPIWQRVHNAEDIVRRAELKIEWC